MLYIAILSLLPLVLFAIANHYYGLRSGVWSGIFSSLTLALIMWLIFDYYDHEILFITASMFGLGLISLKTKSELYIKLQPVFSNLISVLFLLWYELNDRSFFVEFLPKVGQMLSEDQKAMMLSPEFQTIILSLSRYLIFWLLFHAGLMALCAFKGSSKVWIASKVMAIPIVCSGVFLSYWLFQ